MIPVKTGSTDGDLLCKKKDKNFSALTLYYVTLLSTYILCIYKIEKHILLK